MGKGLKSLSCDEVLTNDITQFESGYKVADVERNIYKVRRTLHNVEFSYLVIGDKATAFLLDYLDTVESFSDLKKYLGTDGFKLEDGEGYVLYYPKFRITYASKFEGMEDLLASFGIDTPADYRWVDASSVINGDFGSPVDGDDLVDSSVDGEGTDRGATSVVVGEFCEGTDCDNGSDDTLVDDSSDDELGLEDDSEGILVDDSSDYELGLDDDSDDDLELLDDYDTLAQKVELLTAEVAQARSVLEGNNNLLSSVGATVDGFGKSLRANEDYLALESEVNELRKNVIWYKGKLRELGAIKDKYAEKYELLEDSTGKARMDYVNRVDSLESSLQGLQSEYDNVKGIKRSHDQLHSKLFGSFIERIKFLFAPRTWFNKNMKN